ncbi:MAG: CRISPR-associated endonuclease Cas3'', partial [Oceanibaculum nanhaiense]|nr:CRISPR-associated endonuclease Cas3'' [Oceanibaculum nanhaiense]
MIYWAHSPAREGAPPEALEWHLRRTAALARRFAQAFRAGHWGAAAGLLHDIGKYTEPFQNYIQNGGPRTEHSTAGAMEARRLYGDVLGLLLAYGIAGHHAGLPDGGSKDDRALLSRLKSRGIPQGYGRWEAEFRSKGIGCPAPDLLMKEVLAVLGGAQNDRFAVAFFARMVFSALVDADFLATEWFLDRGKG